MHLPRDAARTDSSSERAAPTLTAGSPELTEGPGSEEYSADYASLTGPPLQSDGEHMQCL